MKANAIKNILALTVAAVMLAAAPAGVGANSGQYLAPDDRPGLHGPGSIDTLPATGPGDYLAPDDRADLHRPGSVDAVSEGDTANYLAPDDRPGQHGPGGIEASAGSDDTSVGVTDASAPTYVRVVANGFDWGSAGIGACAGAGAVLAFVGAVLLVRSDRIRTQAV